MAEDSIDPQLFRGVMGRFATGVTIVSTVDEGEIHGMTANAFMAGSLNPPLCVVAVRQGARMHRHLLAAGHFGVSFLSEDQEHLSSHFASHTVPNIETDFVFRGRTPVLDRAVAAITAEVQSTSACGDHTLFVGRILEMEAADHPPLLFFGGRYLRIPRGESLEETAPPSFL